MRRIAKETLRDFWKRHPDSEQSLKAWYLEVREAEWATSVQLKKRYPSASILVNNRVVFDVGGNKYRLIVGTRYQQNMDYIKWFGTHVEYDRVDAEKVGR